MTGERGERASDNKLKKALAWALFELAEEEGEDTPFSILMREAIRQVKARFGEDAKEELARLARSLASFYDLPPRVAFARMLKDPEWRSIVREALSAWTCE